MGEDGDDSDEVPEVFAENAWVSVRVRGQKDDSTDEVVEAAKEIADHLSEDSKEHQKQENSDGIR